MADDIYKKLAQHLDRLPGGYPCSPSGAEIRILQKLFSSDEAALALHLTLIAEEPRVIANRAGIPLNEVIARLHEMDGKGLIFSIQNNGGIIRYRIQQFVIGFWEAQVKSLQSLTNQTVKTLTAGREWQNYQAFKQIDNQER